MSIYVPKMREGYYYINAIGEIGYLSNTKSMTDIHNIKSGNCYSTEEDAVRARETNYAREEAIKAYYEYCRLLKTENASTICGFYYTLCDDNDFYKYLVSVIGQDKVDLLATEE